MVLSEDYINLENICNIILLVAHLLTCQAMVLVDPYAEGKLGFWIYEQFWEIVVEAELYTKRQHTPNLNKKKWSHALSMA